MKWVKCFLGEKMRNGSYRITHDKIYEVYSQENCKPYQFWIICDNGTKGRFDVSNLEDLKPHEFGFIDAVLELRDNKINQLLNVNN